MKNKILDRIARIAVAGMDKAAERIGEGMEKVAARVDEEINGPVQVHVTPAPIKQPLPEIFDAEIIPDDEEPPDGFAAISLEDHLVRTEVARQLEASFSATTWKEKGDDTQDVIVTRVFPVHIDEANTYTCMVGLARKEVLTEEMAIPLHEFLQMFQPTGTIKFEEYQA